MRVTGIFLAIGVLLGGGIGAKGEVILPAIFSDHMVLQRDARVPVWGRAAPSEKVIVQIDQQIRETIADPGGKWRVSLDLAKSGPGPFQMSVAGSNRIVISDVVVGEVWLAAGQSNMAFGLGKSVEAEKEIPISHDSLLRQFKVLPVAQLYPNDECKGSWVCAGPTTAGMFSAVAYYFGKKLRSEIGSPVGLINCSMSSTPIESWMSGEAMDADPDLKAMKEHLWSLRDGTTSEGKLPIPSLVPGALFHGTVQPLIPYGLAGFLWSQGESNAKRGWPYREALRLLIVDWRTKWGRADLPFYFCQAANFGPRKAEPAESGWAELRESQATALALPNTGMAVLIDTEPGGDLHPRDKKDAGERLAFLALTQKYGKPQPSPGPQFRSFSIEQGKVRLTFDHVQGGLVSKIDAGETSGVSGEKGTPEKPTGFAICGGDRKWRWASSAIEGDSVLVWSDQVPEPVAVRYAWADNPVATLFDGEGLPVAPFRTDNFPVASQKRK
ncbi:sialate O-acetylesterase [soil metagenome]